MPGARGSCGGRDGTRPCRAGLLPLSGLYPLIAFQLFLSDFIHTSCSALAPSSAVPVWIVLTAIVIRVKIRKGLRPAVKQAPAIVSAGMSPQTAHDPWRRLTDIYRVSRWLRCPEEPDVAVFMDRDHGAILLP